MPELNEQSNTEAGTRPDAVEATRKVAALWHALAWTWVALVVWVLGVVLEAVVGEGWLSVAVFAAGLVLVMVALRKMTRVGRPR